MKVILAQPRGFCAGVVRAIEIVERALQKYGPPVYVRHEIVHNKHVVESLKAKGARFVEDLSEVPPNAVTIFSAHGVAKSIEEEAQSRNLPVLNATCPLVTKVHVEAVKFAVALYKEAFTPQVLSWNDASDNQYIDSGVGSFIINPISAYRTAQQLDEKLADKIFLWKCPKGPAHRLIGAASNCYGIWKFSRNQDAAHAFLKYYVDNWVDAFKASTGYNMPLFPNIVPKPMPVLSYDPTSHPPTKLAITETSDEWCAVTGWPGPAWAATDEVYNDFVLCDMMTSAATGKMTPQEAVKWATKQAEGIFNKWGA